MTVAWLEYFNPVKNFYYFHISHQIKTHLNLRLIFWSSPSKVSMRLLITGLIALSLYGKLFLYACFAWCRCINCTILNRKLCIRPFNASMRPCCNWVNIFSYSYGKPCYHQFLQSLHHVEQNGWGKLAVSKPVFPFFKWPSKTWAESFKISWGINCQFHYTLLQLEQFQQPLRVWLLLNNRFRNQVMS